MSVNTVSVLNNKREKKKPQGLFLLLAFNFWPPPPNSFSLPSLSLLPDRPLLLHPPGVSWDPSLLLPWQCLNHLTVVPDTVPPTPSCLPALFSAAAPPSLLLSLKTWLPDKKNHQITAASGPYDDGTTPRGFSPLSQNPLNGCSNHNVLTLWSQVPIPLSFLTFWLSVRPPARPPVSYMLVSRFKLAGVWA